MCGIFCLLHENDDNDSFTQIFKRETKSHLQRRGPNFAFHCRKQLTRSTTAELCGYTLHLRGLNGVVQPIVSRDDDDFLLFNGEIFNGIEVATDENDTEIIFKLLTNCQNENDLLRVFSKIEGPWAFIYWQAKSLKLWFGRDVFGRRSLLWKKTIDANKSRCHFVLSSTACRPETACEDIQGWKEVPATGIFLLDLSGDEQTNYERNIVSVSWVSKSEHNLDLSLLSPITESFCESVPTPNDLNIHFKIKEIASNVESSKIGHEVFSFMLNDEQFQNLQEKLCHVLQLAVKKRIENQTQLCRSCMPSNPSKLTATTDRCGHARVAVLFSGGLDCTVLCGLADRFVPRDEPIDLLNVAFEQTLESFEVPDRISGRQGLRDLQLVSPHRQWKFVEINVTKDQMINESESRIANLVFPSNTVMDNDIGCAIWFAARGKGIVFNDGKYVEYTTPARVVLTGLGADEQLGGYSRHRNSYFNGGWLALAKDLKMEMERIWERNLGRDDRVIADHGREARFPFLDEQVVNYLNTLPIWFKVYLDLPRGIGDKLLLRILAFRLGLFKTAELSKRAIQFGSRIVKMRNSRDGSAKCSALLAVKSDTIE